MGLAKNITILREGSASRRTSRGESVWINFSWFSENKPPVVLFSPTEIYNSMSWKPTQFEIKNNCNQEIPTAVF